MLVERRSSLRDRLAVPATPALVIPSARNLTPRYFARTLAAAIGATAEIAAYGQHILIESISGSTVELALDDDRPEQIREGLHIDVEDRRYSRIVLRNTLAVAATIQVRVAQTWVDLQSTGGILAGIAADMAEVEQEISGVAVANQLALVNVAITGGAGTSLFVANPARTLISLSTPPTNGGFVYLGNAAGNVSATDFMDVIYPGSNWYDERYKGAVFAVGNDALEWVGGYEL